MKIMLKLLKKYQTEASEAQIIRDEIIFYSKAILYQ